VSTSGFAAAAADAAIDLDAAWRLHPQVSVRPERFGALLYHFGTRRLSFLKSPALLTVVSSLAAQPTARAACAAAGIGQAELPAYARALATLASSQMICERTAS
jgi:putative mycofactocin binding protein MftB